MNNFKLLFHKHFNLTRRKLIAFFKNFCAKEFREENQSGLKKSFNSPHKTNIRKKWNEPIIKFISKRIGQKLVYLGLPSPEAEDIQEWIDYIESIIAFQCRDHKNPSDPAQSRVQIETLENYLRKLERQDKIKSYTIYDGYLEEVILKGYDNSPNNITLQIQDFVTLYNLDFCNKITYPQKYVTKDGNVKEVYKFEAISKLLEFQKSVSAISNKFVLFLTVHCSFDGKELQNFLQNPPNNETKILINKYLMLKGIKKNERILRLFITNYIKNQCEAFGFTPNILPVIRYDGLNSTPLLHFAVLGIHSKLNGGVVDVYQNMDDILNQRFINLDKEEMVNSEFFLENEIKVDLNPVSLFSNSTTFRKLWL